LFYHTSLSASLFPFSFFVDKDDVALQEVIKSKVTYHYDNPEEWSAGVKQMEEILTREEVRLNAKFKSWRAMFQVLFPQNSS
jgi:hypothetical protein